LKVIVIGAGVAGLGIGWRLAQQGAGVTVIERGQPGRGATWAAAGMIAAVQEKAEPSAPEEDLARRAASVWPRFAEEIEHASGRAISYRVEGGLVLAQSPSDLEALVARARTGAGEVLSPSLARRIEPRLSALIEGALWNTKDAKVDNRALGAALAAAFAGAGGSILVNEAVVRFEFRDNRILGVRTPFALHQADAYVLAAGAWSGRIEGLPPDALPPIIPVKGEMIALEAPAQDSLPGPAIGGKEIYMVTQRDRLLVGATVLRVGFDSSLTDAASEWLLGRAASLMPPLRDWTIAEQWGGLRPGTPDDRPILGPSAVDGLFIASGQFRSGILYAPAIADALSALILGKSSEIDLAAFDPQRFAGSVHR